MIVRQQDNAGRWQRLELCGRVGWRGAALQRRRIDEVVRPFQVSVKAAW
jgi:hypothetical protein